jgi:hypothetical protein
MLTLLFTILLPVAGVTVLLFIPNDKAVALHQAASHTSSINFIVSLFL